MVGVPLRSHVGVFARYVEFRGDASAFDPETVHRVSQAGPDKRCTCSLGPVSWASRTAFVSWLARSALCPAD